MLTPIILSLTIALSAAPRTEECPDLVGDNPCEDESYLMIMPPPSLREEEDLGACNMICEKDTNPPAPPLVTCIHSPPRFDCEVWPQGPQFTYSWSSSRGLSLLSSSLIQSSTVTTPYEGFTCTQSHAVGVAAVTVTAPNGLWSQREFLIPCTSLEQHPIPLDTVEFN